MKKIKLSLMVLATAMLLASCNSWIQVHETESIGKDAVSKEGVCENSDVKITYDFWAEDGVTYFSIYNKADKPMYIDWKRSVFIYNDWKNNYWIEKTTTETYVVPVGTGSGVTYMPKVSTVWAERYTFIPPHCYVSVPMTYIIMNNAMQVTSETSDNGKTTITVANSLQKRPDAKSLKTSIPKYNGTASGNVKAWAQSYDKDKSPNRFRNFLTYSFDEKFTTEKFVENDFYVSKITEMTAKNFGGTKYKANMQTKVGRMKSKSKVTVYQSPYRSNTTFYNTVIR